MHGVEVFIGLGSNLQGPQAQVTAGLKALAELPGYTALAASALFQTAPVGMLDQPSFINAVAHGRFRGRPEDLLAGLQAIEQGAGRVRKERWGPRTLDLDILLFADEVVDRENLKIPHPEIPHRAFVLVPLAELAPDLVLPVWQATPVQLLARMPGELLARQKVVKL